MKLGKISLFQMREGGNTARELFRGKIPSVGMRTIKKFL